MFENQDLLPDQGSAHNNASYLSLSACQTGADQTENSI